MRLFLTCALFICFAGPICPRAIADDPPAPVAVGDKPSDDTIREFHSAVAAGDLRLATKMLANYPALLSAPLPDDDAAKQVAPILTAVNNGQAKLVAMLLKQGASYNTGKPGNTPVFRAALLGHSEILQMLLDAGANIEGMDPNANGGVPGAITTVTPLRAALCCGKMDAARYLVSRGAQIDIFSASGLGWSNWVAKQVKAHPDQATASDDWNFKPLTYAVATGCPGTAEILLANGADGDEVSSVDHGTFLHLAALNGSGDLIAVLLAHGARVNVKNDKGDSALDLAEKAKQEDAAQTLRDHGAKHGADL